MKCIIQQFSKLLVLPLLVVVLMFQVKVFADENTCAVCIPIEVQTQGESIPTQIEYKIAIKAENEQNPMPNASEVIVKNDGKAEFAPITYTTTGKYKYSVYQIKGDASDFTYDEAVYTVTISIVKDGTNNLKSEMYVVKNNSQAKTDKIIFSNSYKVSQPTEEKTVTNETEEVSETKQEYETTEVSETVTESATTPIKDTVTSAPKTGERIFSAIVVGVFAIAMLVLSIIFYRKRTDKE